MSERQPTLPQPRELSDQETMQEFIKVFGPLRAVHLLGWMTYWTVRGRPSLRSVVKAAREMHSTRPSVYKFIADMKRWREHVAKLEGREPEPIDDLDELVAWFEAQIRSVSVPSAPAPART